MSTPWRSETIWLAVIGLTALVVAGALGVIDMNGIDIVTIVGSMILGRAWQKKAEITSAGPTQEGGSK
jgi:hypothetical protein